MTNNAAKKAARKYQRETGVSYTEALRHVTEAHAPSGNQGIPVERMLELLGIRPGSTLDVSELWATRTLPTNIIDLPRLDEFLQVPIGLRTSGDPLVLDLKDEFEGGHGPHGLMIGKSGSGKTTTLAALAFGLFAQHSPDVVRAVFCDYKGSNTFGAFADWPHVESIVTNLNESPAQAKRFAETVTELLDQRVTAFAAVGRDIETLGDYNRARCGPSWSYHARLQLPPMPYMFVFVDDFSGLFSQYPDLADLLGSAIRRGRSLGVYFLFAGQALDEHSPTSTWLLDQTQHQIGLKVASESLSQRVIGTADAFHKPDDNPPGAGYYTTGPGRELLEYQGFRVPQSLLATLGKQFADQYAALR